MYYLASPASNTPTREQQAHVAAVLGETKTLHSIFYDEKIGYIPPQVPRLRAMSLHTRSNTGPLQENYYLLTNAHSQTSSSLSLLHAKADY